MNNLNNSFLIGFFLLLFLAGKTQTLDVSKATIITFEKTDKVVLKAVSVLQEEVANRTGIPVPVNSKPNKSANPVIYIGLENQTANFPVNIQKLSV